MIAAAGHGHRLGGEVPKQYREVAGVPLLLRALRAFASHPDVAHIAVVLPPADAGRPPRWLADLASSTLGFIAGGAERADSVRAGLAALPESCEYVLVHDAARPFVSRETIDAVLAEARAGVGAVAAVPLADTLKEVDPEERLVTGTIPRERLWRAQTPQGFPRRVLAAAYARSGAAGATDDATVVERAGHPVRVVPDSPRNFKVTTAEDLALAELWAGRAR